MLAVTESTPTKNPSEIPTTQHQSCQLTLQHFPCPGGCNPVPKSIWRPTKSDSTQGQHCKGSSTFSQGCVPFHSHLPCRTVLHSPLGNSTVWLKALYHSHLLSQSFLIIFLPYTSTMALMHHFHSYSGYCISIIAICCKHELLSS